MNYNLNERIKPRRKWPKIVAILLLIATLVCVIAWLLHAGVIHLPHRAPKEKIYY